MTDRDKLEKIQESFLIANDAMRLALRELAAALHPGHADGLTSVTIQLRDADYARLKRFGINQRMQSQTILVQAMHEYLDREEGKGT